MTDARPGATLAITLAALAILAGCADHSSAQPPNAVAEQHSGEANWPDHCRERVGEARDYAMDAPGYPVLADALLAEAPGSGYRLERVPGAPHRRVSWLIVNADTNTIYAQASAFHGHRGWLVDELERCA